MSSTEQATAEITHATELLKRIEAMSSNPYWNSERRWKIQECAMKATQHLKTATECLQPSTPTSSSSAGS